MKSANPPDGPIIQYFGSFFWLQLPGYQITEGFAEMGKWMVQGDRIHSCEQKTLWIASKKIIP